VEPVDPGDDVSEEEAFQDISRLEQARIVLHCARSLISPTTNSFSYRTPVLSVSRSGGGPQTILADIERRLANLEANRMVGYDSDLWSLLGYGKERLAYGQYTPGIGFSP